MRAIILFFIAQLSVLLSGYSQSKVDTYKMEADGYFTSFNYYNGNLIFTDNYANRLYLLDKTTHKLMILSEAPGCGRYYKKRGNKLFFKWIDKNTLQQAPATLDLNTGKVSFLHAPAALCGQPDVDNNGQIIYSIGNVLHCVNANGTEKTFDLGYYSNWVSLAPDGNYLAFTSNNDDELAILDMHTGVKNVFTPKGCVYPVWSPDSKKILYNSLNGYLFVYDLETGNTYSLGKGGKPQWIDNDYFVYQHNVDSNLTFYGSDLFLAKYDASMVKNLTNTSSRFEMSPFYYQGKLYYSAYNDRKIFVAALVSDSLANEQVVWNYSAKTQVYKTFSLKSSSNKSIVHIPNVPYVHQRYDTPSWHNGSGSCAPTTSIMAIAFYNRLPKWPTVVDHGYSFDPHTSYYGSYVADKYHFNEIYYDTYEDAYGTDAWGGYGYMWNGNNSPSSTMRQYIENHKIVSNQLWTSSCTFSNTTTEIDNGYVHPICAYITSSGHLILARGYVVGQHTLIFNDPAGNKNTAPYFNYYGTDAYYDWPGYNNGYENLDPDGSHGGVAWTVKAESSQPVYNDTIIDNNYYEHGFYMNNSQNGAHMRFFRDYNGGYNGHCWYTLTMADASDVCYVTWTPNLPQTGVYEVSVYIPDNHANATNAMYHVHYDNGESVVHIDQSAYSDQWVSLGTFHFSQGQNGYVYLGDSTGTDYNDIAFDAVKWEKMPVGLDFQVTNVSCNGGNDGSITVTPTDGTPPFVYAWNTNPSQTTQTATGLSAGTYEVTVTDNDGNTYVGSATVTEPTPIQNTISVSNPSVSGASDGSITLNTSGGTPPYSYIWQPNVSTTNSASGLQEGTYIITTTDANNCTHIDTVELVAGGCPVPTNLIVNNVSVSTANISWSGASSDGYVVGIAEQGTNNWTYYYVNDVQYTFTGLAANTHYDCSVASVCGNDTTSFIFSDFITQNISNQTITTCSGVFTDDGGDNANYSDGLDYTVTITPNNATQISITFHYADIEANYDTLYIYDGNSVSAPLLKYISGTTGFFTVVSSGGALTFRFVSDGATNKAGWYATWVSYGGDCDSIPLSSSDSSDVWRTGDYTQTFTDVANTPLGFKQKFYDVIYYENNRWVGNGGNGFFNDNFEQNTIDNTLWTIVSGSWNIESAHLVQIDETLSNENIYANVEQDNSHSYLYHWYMAMTGTGTNRRAGIYIFASDGGSDSRGNSYMIWFRLDNDLVQIYKVHDDNTYDLVTNDPYDFADGAWYDYKVFFDPQSGELSVYINGIKVSSWIDPSPYQAGHYISLRTGNAKVYYDDIKVYKSRGNSALVTVGDNVNKDIQVQSIGGQPVARVKTMVINAMEHISDLSGNELKIDWTPPQPVSYVYDGTGADIDTTFDPHNISANWSSSADTNSDISNYWFAIGTSPEGTDVQDWLSVGTDTFVTASGFVALQNNVTYYVTVKAQNGAGLYSTPQSSDGQIAKLDPVLAFEADRTEVCVGDTVHFYNNTLYADSYTWLFQGGNPSSSNLENPYVVYTQPGDYDVTLIAYNSSGTNFALTHNAYIHVVAAPQAMFTASPQNLTLPDTLVVFNNNSINADSYLWDFGDGSISTETNPWHSYHQVGDYHVVLHAQNQVCGESLASIDISVINDVNEINTQSFISVYPNPTHSYLKLNASSNVMNNIKKIEIVSTDGKTYMSFDKWIEKPIDISVLPKGTYFVKVVNKNKQTIVKKFVKK